MYYLTTSAGERQRVCPKVFFATLQVKPKFVRYTCEHADEGFSKSDSRGKHEPKIKLDEERLQSVLNHTNSFPRVAGHYVRKSSTKTYIEETTNFSKLTKQNMHELYLTECKINQV